MQPRSPAEEQVDRQPLVSFGRRLFASYVRIYHNLTLAIPCTLPPAGPAILVCNHLSGLDPVLIQSACPRLIVWMMAREYYRLPVLRHLYPLIGAIPVERSGHDLAATRAALRALADGRILGIFPEGRIETERQLLPFQTGVALLAQRSGAPVYPAYLDGTMRGTDMASAFLLPQRATLAFGRSPVLQADHTRQSIENNTVIIRNAVAELQNRMHAHPNGLFARQH